jgi:hypothetical protein
VTRFHEFVEDSPVVTVGWRGRPLSGHGLREPRPADQPRRDQDAVPDSLRTRKRERS